MTRVGNHTNSADPQSVNSRLFVGNLNTQAVTKEELGRIFQRYGSVIGISMHKGYAFIQFTDTWDARNAAMGEDGRMLGGQLLDVNLVSEPKPHQIIKKRQNNSTATCVDTHQSSTTAKRAKIDKATKAKEKAFLSSLSRTYISSDPDILICGNCKELFQGIQTFFEHKKQSCKLRFSCKCQKGDATNDSTPVCTRCEAKFPTWWDLIQHLETEHNIIIHRKPQETIANPSTSSDTDQELSNEFTEELRDSTTNSWDSHSINNDSIWVVSNNCSNGDSDVVNENEAESSKDDILNRAEKSVGTEDLLTVE